MLKNWNACKVGKGEVFHFKNSLRPFITFENSDGDYCFLDIDEMMCYEFKDLEHEGLKFYQLEENEDYMGVEVDGKIEWVN